MLQESGALVVASWNLKGGLSDASRASTIADRICESRPDVIALPDAWHEDSVRSRPSDRRLLVSPRDFEKEGYCVIDADFEEDRTDANYARFHFLLLTRSDPSHESSVIRLGTRPAVAIDAALGETALHIVGLYLNDQSERNRQTQLHDLQAHLANSPNRPTLLAGDFNAMHRDTKVATLLRHRLSRHTLGKVGLFNRTLPRLVEMADGATMQALADTGFSDCDPTAAPTMHSRARLFQLDHILARGLDEANLATTPTARRFYPRLSDHAMVWTEVKTKDPR